MPTIDISKIYSGAELQPSFNSKKVEEMKSDILSICHTISSPSNRFNAKEAYNEIKEYVSKYDRLLYAEISTFCYNLRSNESDNFQGNCNSLIEYVFSNDYDNGIKAEKGKGNEDEVSLRERTKRIVIKLYDNVNLACAQLNSLKQSKEELHQYFVTEFEPAKAEITKDVNSQLITLVGIFTAIAFLVFGGFSSLSNVFSHIEDNIAKTILLTSIWGLIICNSVFIFLGCIERIVQKENALFQKNGLFFWTNFILLFIFCSSLWTFIVGKYSWWGSLIFVCENAKSYIAIAGYVLIVLFFALVLLITRKERESIQSLFERCYQFFKTKEITSTEKGK